MLAIYAFVVGICKYLCWHHHHHHHHHHTMLFIIIHNYWHYNDDDIVLAYYTHTHTHMLMLDYLLRKIIKFLENKFFKIFLVYSIHWYGHEMSVGRLVGRSSVEILLATREQKPQQIKLKITERINFNIKNLRGGREWVLKSGILLPTTATAKG